MTQHRFGGALAFALVCFLALTACASSASADEITTNSRSIWRDYTSDGVPTSGAWNPNKGQIRAWGALVGSGISALQAAQTSGTLAFDTKANMDASLAYAANTMAFVFADTTLNNGIYRKLLDSGLGSWSKVSTLIYGPTPTLTLGTVTRTACNTDPAVAMSGTALAPTINYSLPDCDINVTVGTVSTTACGTYPTITKSGTDWAPVFAFTFPDCSAALGGLAYKGTWNAATNSPTLSGGSGSVGDYYIVATAGSTNLSGVSTWAIGDYLIRYSSGWQRVALSTIANAEYATKAAFVSALSSITGASAGQVARVRSVAAPGVNYGTCGLVYVAATSSTGTYGEVSGAGLYWQPQYSSNPVETCEFGAVGDASYAWTGATLLGTSSGSSATITVSSKTGLSTGMLCTSMKWHSQAIAGLATAATINSINPSLNQITLSATPPAGTSVAMACWNDMSGSTVSGTEAYGPLQAAIDYALTNRARKLRIANGRYKLSQGLMLGYGRGFATLDTEGAGAAYNDLAGTQFVCVDRTRPCLNAQGLRTSRVSGISLVGPNTLYGLYGAAYIDYTGTTSHAGLSPDIYDWIAPNLSVDPAGSTPGGLRRYAPSVGIAIDGYSGTSPAAPYGTYTTPTALNGGSPPADAYGRNLTSNLEIDHVQILGFGISVAAGLNTNSQGDFVSLTNSSTGYGPVAFYIGQQNGRNALTRYHFVNTHHTVYTGAPSTSAGSVALGWDTGHWDGIIDAMSGSTIYQVIDWNGTGNVGPMIFRQSYCELCARFGNFIGTSSWPATLTFEGGEFTTDAIYHRRVPASFLTSGGSGSIILDGGYQILGPRTRIWSLVAGGQPLVEIRNAHFRAMFGYTGGSAAVAAAANYLGGTAIGSPNMNVTGKRTGIFTFARGVKCAADGSTCSDSRVLSDEHQFADSHDILTQATRSFTDYWGKRFVYDLPAYSLIDPSSTGYIESGSGPTWSTCDTVTFNYIGAKQTAKSTEIQVGYAIDDYITQTIWVVTAVGSVNGSGNYPITMKQQNNLVQAGDESCATATHPSTAGTYWLILPTKNWISQQIEFGTFTSGSTSVTGVSGGNGYCGDFSSWVANGDYLWGGALTDSYRPWFVSDNGRNSVSSINTGTCVLTLGANATASGRFPITAYPVH